MVNDMDFLAVIKRRLGIAKDDHLQDELIQDLVDATDAQFKLLTGATVIEDKYHFIIVDIAVKRFNRLGSEGMTVETVEGHSMTFSDNDFEPYLALLERDFDLDNRRERGRVMWG